MARRRPRGTSAPSDLPPTRRLRWAVAATAAAILAVVWLRAVPDDLLGPVGADVTLAGVRELVLTAVPVILGLGVLYSVWRLRLEWLAHRPGPVLVRPFQTPPEDDNTAAGTAHAVALTSLFQAFVVRSQLYGPTAIPASGRSTDFLTVVERAGESMSGPWRGLAYLARLLAPPSAYQVECTILPHQVVGDRPALQVELTRFPNAFVAPTMIQDETWERVVERAAHWVAGKILPRTGRCVESPWTMWRGLRLPDDLFDCYQRFQTHKRHQELDEAMAVLRAALRLDPSSLALRLEMGKLQEQLGLHLDALATYEDIIGRASRTDRGLALLWNLPPDQWGHESDDDDDRAWSDSRRAAELPAEHPVVYVARYRHMLLLGLGDRLAAQWWPPPAGDQKIGEHDVADRCDNEDHWPAHERRRDHSRQVLGRRLQARYPWVTDELDERGLLATASSTFLAPKHTHDAKAMTWTATRAADLRIFLTTASLCELELLLLERGRDLVTRRAVRDVVSLRTLRLVLPSGVIRAGLAIASVHGRGPRRPADPARAGESVVFRLSRPHIMPEVGRGLLDQGWPPDLAVLRRYTARTLRSRTLHSWHEHYNAACTYALLLLRPGPGVARGGTEDDSSQAHEVSDAAVTQLHKAVACGDSGFLAARREWLLAEDPDLDVLRGRREFFELEAATYGTVRGTERRGPELVTWQIRTLTSRVLLVTAQRMRGLWSERLLRRQVTRTAVLAWAAQERSVWAAVVTICRDHQDSTERHAGTTVLREQLGDGLELPEHPRFSPRALASQFDSLSFDGPDARPSIEQQVETVIEHAALRFAGVVHALHEEAGADEHPARCSRERALIPGDKADELARAIDPSERHSVSDDNAEYLRRRWAEDSRARWSALAELFDDVTARHGSMPDRWREFYDAVRSGAATTTTR